MIWGRRALPDMREKFWSFRTFCLRVSETHEVDPQLYLTRLFMNPPQAKVSELADWLPDQWKIRQRA